MPGSYVGPSQSAINTLFSQDAVTLQSLSLPSFPVGTKKNDMYRARLDAPFTDVSVFGTTVIDNAIVVVDNALSGQEAVRVNVFSDYLELRLEEALGGSTGGDAASGFGVFFVKSTDSTIPSPLTGSAVYNDFLAAYTAAVALPKHVRKTIIIDDRSTNTPQTIAAWLNGSTVNTYYLAANNIRLSTVSTFGRKDIEDQLALPPVDSQAELNKIIAIYGKYDALHFDGGLWKVMHGAGNSTFASNPFSVVNNPSFVVSTPNGLRRALEIGDNSTVYLSPMSFFLDNWGSDSANADPSLRDDELTIGRNSTLRIWPSINLNYAESDIDLINALWGNIYTKDGNHGEQGTVDRLPHHWADGVVITLQDYASFIIERGSSYTTPTGGFEVHTTARVGRVELGTGYWVQFSTVTLDSGPGAVDIALRQAMYPNNNYEDDQSLTSIAMPIFPINSWEDILANSSSSETVISGPIDAHTVYTLKPGIYHLKENIDISSASCLQLPDPTLGLVIFYGPGKMMMMNYGVPNSVFASSSWTTSKVIFIGMMLGGRFFGLGPDDNFYSSGVEVEYRQCVLKAVQGSYGSAFISPAGALFTDCIIEAWGSGPDYAIRMPRLPGPNGRSYRFERCHFRQINNGNRVFGTVVNGGSRELGSDYNIDLVDCTAAVNATSECLNQATDWTADSGGFKVTYRIFETMKPTGPMIQDALLPGPNEAIDLSGVFADVIKDIALAIDTTGTSQTVTDAMYANKRVLVNNTIPAYGTTPAVIDKTFIISELDVPLGRGQVTELELIPGASSNQGRSSAAYAGTYILGTRPVQVFAKPMDRDTPADLIVENIVSPSTPTLRVCTILDTHPDDGMGALPTRLTLSKTAVAKPNTTDPVAPKATIIANGPKASDRRMTIISVMGVVLKWTNMGGTIRLLSDATLTLPGNFTTLAIPGDQSAVDYFRNRGITLETGDVEVTITLTLAMAGAIISPSKPNGATGVFVTIPANSQAQVVLRSLENNEFDSTLVAVWEVLEKNTMALWDVTETAEATAVLRKPFPTKTISLAGELNSGIVHLTDPKKGAVPYDYQQDEKHGEFILEPADRTGKKIIAAHFHASGAVIDDYSWFHRIGFGLFTCNKKLAPNTVNGLRYLFNNGSQGFTSYDNGVSSAIGTPYYSGTNTLYLGLLIDFDAGTIEMASSWNNSTPNFSTQSGKTLTDIMVGVNLSVSSTNGSNARGTGRVEIGVAQPEGTGNSAFMTWYNAAITAGATAMTFKKPMLLPRCAGPGWVAEVDGAGDYKFGASNVTLADGDVVTVKRDGVSIVKLG